MTHASDPPLRFDDFIEQTGPAEYETNWRNFRIATKVAGAITAIALFLFFLGLLGGEPVWSLLLLAPIAAAATYVLHLSGAVTGVRIDDKGIACLPEGPRITAREIVSVEPPDGSNPLYESFEVRIAEPRVVPMIAPLMFMGRRVGVSLAKRVTRRRMD